MTTTEIAEMAESFTNGNHTHVVNELCALPSAAQALVAIRLYDLLQPYLQGVLCRMLAARVGGYSTLSYDRKQS